MKKKVWVPVVICIVAVLIAAGCLLGRSLLDRICINQARYIETVHGHMLLIDGSPVSVSGSDRMFQGLTFGDEVLVVHSLIAESYPGQAKAYLCIKQADGEEGDIPGPIRQSLTEMGWLLCDGSESPQPEDPLTTGQEVSYEYGCVTMSLTVPDDWTYRILKGAENENSYGIELYHPGGERPLALYAYPEGVGFCGTGLDFETATVAGYAASVAYTSGEKHLAHVYFTDIPGEIVLLNQGINWQQYGRQAMQIAETVKIHVDTISQDEAQRIAEEQADWDYYAVTHQLDHQSGDWTVTFWSRDREYFTIVTVSADGQLLSVALPDQAE